ncbi:MAG: hypothetical protein AB8B55_23655 [Mariniblastus sp.]
MKLSILAPSGFSQPIVLGLIFLFSASLLSVSAAQDRERRRGKFDVEGYLKGIDTNKNGVLEESEMSDRTKGFIKKMGIDTDRPVKISKVVGKINKDKKDREKEKEKAARSEKIVLNIKGFGIDPAETKPISSFGPSADGTTTQTKFSDSVWEQVDSTLARYDRNKDGKFDKDEMKRISWGNPPPNESDTNKDGNLSKQELAQRYADREAYAKRASSSKASSSSADARKRRAQEREKFRSSGRSSSSSSRSTARTSRSTPSSKSTTSSTKNDAASREKYKRYAASLVKTYDKDSDGRLSKDELAKMRRPPIGADGNKDGFVTEAELLDSLTNSSKPKSESSASTSSDRKKSSSDRKSRGRGGFGSRTSSRSSESGGTGNSSFDKLDDNENKRVEMHEFSKDWDDKKVKEFYEKDKNGDGIITIDEWNER